jgi:hypothetical protein
MLLEHWMLGNDLNSTQQRHSTVIYSPSKRRARSGHPRVTAPRQDRYILGEPMNNRLTIVVQDWTVTFIWCSIAALTTCEFSASLISKDKGGLHELFKFFIPASKRVPISPLDQISSPKLKYAVNCTMFFKNVIEVHYTDDWLLPHTDRHTHTHTHTHTCTHARTHTRTHTHTVVFCNCPFILKIFPQHFCKVLFFLLHRFCFISFVCLSG